MVAAAESYAVEQEKLSKQLEGNSEIHIQAPKEPEVNPALYRDVEPMLFRGFLTLTARINGVIFVFKSLNQHEYELLGFTGGMQTDAIATQKFWDIFLAYGVFMIDGVNILPEREKFIPKIAEAFAEFPPDARQRVIRHLSEVNRRANNAVTITECYSSEIYSRFRWAQIKGLDPTSTAVTGIHGTERLGMNWAQHVWRALNYYEDRNEEHDREWENAKFIGSCMVGKGIQKVYHQDTERRRKERDERLARKDRLLRQVYMGESADDKAQQLQGAVVVAARSVDELAGQLEKDLRGEKDWHDQVVEAQEQRIRTNLQGRRDHLEQLVQSHEQEFGRKTITGGTNIAGLTAIEVQERILRTKQLEFQAAARGMVHPELADPKMNAFIDKWGMTDAEVGSSLSETDKDISNVVPIILPQTNPRGTPFGKK
jgi:hypothetical protein